MTPFKQNIQHIQDVASKDIVAFGTGASVGSFAVLSDMATLFEQIGMICGGILSILVLGNWLYMHIFKKKNK